MKWVEGTSPHMADELCGRKFYLYVYLRIDVSPHVDEGEKVYLCIDVWMSGRKSACVLMSAPTWMMEDRSTCAFMSTPCG